MEWWAIAAVAAALGGVGWWWWSRRPPADGARKDRYAAEAVITPAQAKLYRHLQEAFPDQVVLFAQPLSQLVSVRHAGDRQRALQRLRDQVVDFVVCAPDGKPSFAFQVDAYRSGDEDQARRDASLKHRVLATAGVRMLRLKKSVRHLPSPQELRQRLEATSLANAPEADLEEAVPLGWRAGQAPVPTDRVRSRRGNHAEATDSMSLTDLMGLPPASAR